MNRAADDPALGTGRTQPPPGTAAGTEPGATPEDYARDEYAGPAEHGRTEDYVRAEDYARDEAYAYEAEHRARQGDGRARRFEPRIVPSIKRVAEDATTLFSKELALLKAELTSAIGNARAGIGAMAAGGAVLYAGLLCLLFAAITGLALYMDLWLSALIVGAVVVLIGAIMLWSGKRKVEPAAFKPEHTSASLRKDRDMLREHGRELGREVKEVKEMGHESHAR